MNESVMFVQMKKLERVAEKLRGNFIDAHIAATAAEVPGIVAGLLAEGQTVTYGGSLSLQESGVMDMLRAGRYNLLDRDAAGADKAAIQLAAFSADAYLASANAVTEQGEIYEIDGNGNRVAAIAYGPASVILVVGRNKIVPDLDAARARRGDTAAPANCKRLGVQTPCAVTGTCADCSSERRICSIELVLTRQMHRGRIKVVLVNEELGF